MSDEVIPVCGIIMPISAMPPKYDAPHWSDVRKVLDGAIKNAGMTPQIVSDSFETDVIQQRIIHNLYDNPVVVCDVSGLNPNVMFELGMRITFKLPVVIVTDDIGSVPFDTKIIEHLSYPIDLHIHKTNEFSERLTEKIARLRDQKVGGTFKSFIEAFGTFEVLEPTTKPVAADQLILERIKELTNAVSRLERRPRPSGVTERKSRLHPTRNDTISEFSVHPINGDLMRLAHNKLKALPFISEIVFDTLDDASGVIIVEFISRSAREQHSMEVASQLTNLFDRVVGG